MIGYFPFVLRLSKHALPSLNIPRASLAWSSELGEKLHTVDAKHSSNLTGLIPDPL